MGYRHYFYKVEKELLDKIHNFQWNEFYEWGMKEGLIRDVDANDAYLPLYTIGEEVYCFGKYYENAHQLQEEGKPLFGNFHLREHYEEYEPFIVGKEAVLNAIEYQKKLIIEHYEYMLLLSDEEREEKEFDTRTKEEMYRQHIDSMYKQWKSPFKRNACFAVNVDEDNPAISTSLMYEYSIFELVRIYKATDWEKYGLLFMGW